MRYECHVLDTLREGTFVDVSYVLHVYNGFQGSAFDHFLWRDLMSIQMVM